MISLHDLRYQCLWIDALDIPPGITSVIGKNGSGKTTLLRCCAGIAEPVTGTVLVDGQSPGKTEIGWVNEFPDRNILFSTVADEVASPLRFNRVPCAEHPGRVEEALESMHILPLRNRSIRELSGGEKILVALAAALVMRPKVLVLDEYDSHLDEARILGIERLIRDHDIPYVIRCTQQMETARRGDHLIFLESGRVRYQGTPDQVFTSLSGTAFCPITPGCGK
jgi:energy-coupling factor transport system ATP-binding protein